MIGSIVVATVAQLVEHLNDVLNNLPYMYIHTWYGVQI